MNKFPVISLTLKGVEGRDFESAYAQMRNLILEEVNQFNYLTESSLITESEKRKFKRLLSDEVTISEIKSSLKTLSYLLEKHHGQKAVILIDEYDVPLDKAYVNGYYDEMIDLIRAMFGSALKTNTSLQFAVLTGCLRVSKESIFTGLNNFKVCGISDTKYTEFFGFTNEEVCEMFKYYDVEDRLSDAQAWYDGYRFDKMEVYCPWDVINFCDDLRSNPNAEPTAYWINTSGNSIVRKLIEKTATEFIKDDIETLIDGGTIKKELNLNITHREIDEDINNLWSLLYMTGYLTTTEPPSKGIYSLCIPNFEIAQIYVQQVRKWFDEGLKQEAIEKNEKIEQLFNAFEQGNASTVEELLNQRLLTAISFSDSYEAFYHGFLIGIFGARPSWDARSNAESGYGKSDILVKTMGYVFAAVIEVKRLPAGEYDKMDEACEKALAQIEEKQYVAALKEQGYTQILKYGIAFCGKKCKVAVAR